MVQDVRFETDNILFRKEKFYSPSARKTYLAELPRGYTGQFGPGLKALALVEYYACNVAEPKLLELLRSIGVVISAGQLSNLLIKQQADFHAEKAAVYAAGLGSSPWQHLDQTSTRVDGVNQQCHVVCNPLYTAFFTTASKDRLSVLDVLRNLAARTFRLNAEAFELLHVLGVAQRVLVQLQALPQEQTFSETQLASLLDQQQPPITPPQRQHILEATAIAAYHAQLEFPVIQLLLCDDAPQFNWLTGELALCWVHEGRHYKKLAPYVPQHQQLLAEFHREIRLLPSSAPGPRPYPLSPPAAMSEETLRRQLYDSFKNRAMIYYLIFDELRNACGEAQAEEVLGAAIRRRGEEKGREQYACFAGNLAGLKKAFLDGIPDDGRMFRPEVLRGDDAGLDIQFNACPLKEAWQEAGLPADDVATLCRIAAQIDHGTFESAGFQFQAETWQPGRDGCCCLHIRPGKVSVGCDE